MSAAGSPGLPVRRILHGDALTILRTLPDNSVDSCITSPPYLWKREYGKETETVWDGDPNCQHEWGEAIVERTRHGPNATAGNTLRGVCGLEGKRGRFCRKCGAWQGSLGQEPYPFLFVQHLVEIFREVRRVLKPWGTLWIVIDDSHASGGEAAGLKPGDLIGIPSMVAHALRDDGYYWRSDLIWAKSISFCLTYSGTVMPESVKDRPTKAHEHILMFGKAGRPHYWVNEKTRQLVSKHPPGTKGIEGTDWDWADCPRCSLSVGKTKIDAEKAESFSSPRARYHRHQERDKCKQCGGSGKVKRNLWEGHNYYYDQDAEREPLRSSTITRGKYGRKSSKHLNHPIHAGAGGSFQNAINDGKTDAEVGFAPAEGRNLRSVWTVNPESSKIQHFATFPKALVRPMIRLSCPEQVCQTCGKPRTRIVKSVTVKRTGQPTSNPNHRPRLYIDGKASDPQAPGLGQAFRFTEAAGWSDCGHDNYKPGVVLDIFAGSGTTCAVAKTLGRSYVGIELNREYVRMAEERVRSAEVEIRSLEAYLPT